MVDSASIADTSTIHFLSPQYLCGNVSTMADWKKNRRTVEVICDTCGNPFQKIKSEYVRTSKHYCSRTCVGKANHSHLRKYDNSENLITENRHDEFTGFREFIRRAKNRGKLGDLTLGDLKEQWTKQNGSCPYTGIKLVLPVLKRICDITELASLDRIDSSKPYEKGNIVFVSTPINYMKSSMSEEAAIKYCKIITEFWNK